MSHGTNGIIYVCSSLIGMHAASQLCHFEYIKNHNILDYDDNFERKGMI